MSESHEANVIEDYIILEEDNSEALENKVQDKLKDGYFPKDGLKVIPMNDANDTGLMYVQAMVKAPSELDETETETVDTPLVKM